MGKNSPKLDKKQLRGMEQGAGVYLEGVARVARAAGAGTTPAAQVARTVDMFTTPFGYVRSEPTGCTGG